MIRLVIGVALASALLAATLPAVSDARADRSDARVEGVVERLRTAALSLLTEDAAVTGAGARRVLTVRLPTESLVSAPVDQLAISCRRGCTVAYRVADTRRSVALADLPLATPDGPVVFGTPGPHRLVLGLVPRDSGGAGRDTGPTVTVRLAEVQVG